MDKNILYSLNKPLILLSFLLSVIAFGQQTISGKIVDEKSQKEISGVSIFKNNQNTPFFTTTNGTFSITLDSLTTSLIFRKKGFLEELYYIDKNNLSGIVINLAPEETKVKQIDEVIVQGKVSKFKNKKENPAYAVMQEVWKRKRNNGLNKFNSYTFKEYEKIQFDANNIDSAFTERKIFNKLDFIFDYADSAANGKMTLPIYLAESVFENYGENKPNKRNKRLLTAQKTSGFKDNQVVTLTAQNLYRDINIYDNTLNYFDIGFPSPAGRDGFSTYDYNIIDTVDIKGDRTYKIKYEAKRKEALAFQGYLYVNMENYAIVSASLRSNNKINVNFVNGIFTEMDFENPDDETFLPSKIVTVIDMSPFSKNKKKAKGILARRSVDYTDYEFNKPIAANIFETKEEEFDEKFIEKDESYWTQARPDSLSKQETGIYEMLDKLEKTPKFRRLVGLYETLASGYLNVGNAIDIGSIFSIYGFNEVEGNRIRLGARTYFSQNDMARLQFYTAYGFKDQQFKYGVEGKWMLNKANRFTIGAGTRRDIMQLGVQLTTDDGIMTRTFASSAVLGRGENASLSSVNQTNVFSSIEPWKNFQIRFDGTLQSIKSANPEGFNLHYYLNGDLRKTVNDSRIAISLIARPGAKYSKTGVDRYEHGTLAPTIVLKYTRGIEGLFNADFNYNKLQFLFYKPFLIGSWGRLQANFEAGKNFNPVPLALQNVIPGNQSYGLAPNTFSQLNYYEFVADNYSTLHLEHHFNGKILSFIPLINKLKLREVAFIRMAYGTLSEESKAINVDRYRYSAPDQQIYYEYGFGIENIGFGNLRIFRVDFNWRGNYLHHEDVSKFGIKAGFQFGF